MKSWSTACPDWAERVVAGESLITFPPLFPEYAKKALDVFCSLRIVDLPGKPTFGEVSRKWVLDFVSSVFGAYDEENGVQLIKEYFLCVSKKNTKALALETPIPCPEGWKPIKDVHIGDKVFGVDGKQYDVISESEIFKDHECYKVYFSNGETVIADAGHQWFTYALADRPGIGPGNDNHIARRNRVRTTEEIYNSLFRPYDGARNHSIKLPLPLVLPEVELPIKPYTLGAWLGDGHNRSARITSADEEVMENIEIDGYLLGKRTAQHKSKAWAQMIGITDRSLCLRGHKPIRMALRYDQKRKQKYHRCLDCEKEIDHNKRNGTPLSPIIRYSLQEILRENNLLNNKHIPKVYLRASYNQRLALLQGLMDTDGCVNKNGRVFTFVNKNKRLIEGVSELLSTFGVKNTTIKRDVECNGNPSGHAYFIQFTTFRDLLPIFRLTRKLDRMRYSYEIKSKNRSRSVQITNVEKIDSVPVKCISVNSPDHQFLFGKTMLPTHNSTLAAGIMLTALILNWRESAEFIILSPTVKVADNSFRPANDMCREDVNERLHHLMHVQGHLKRITHLNTKAFLNVVAADSQAVSGIKGTGHFIDELHEFGKNINSENMIREATGGMASRQEGFIIWATTQSHEAPVGIFKQKLDYARAVRDGRIDDPQFLPMIYEFPSEFIEEKKYLDPKYFYITNPNLGASVGDDFLPREFKKAEEAGPSALQVFLAKHLNIETDLAFKTQRWTGADFWEAAKGDVTLERILEVCEVVVIGIDGGGLDDLLGLAVIGRHAETRDWLLWTRAWMHPVALQRRKSEASKYHDFAKDGDLVIIDDMGQDVEQVGDIVMMCEDAGLLDRIGVDPICVGDIVDEIESRELPNIHKQEGQDRIINIPQGWRLSGAIKTTERRLAGTEEGGKRLIHGGQALMSWCVGNARCEVKGNNLYITKQASGTAKIDPLMATLNAVCLMALNPEPRKTKSIYDKMSKEEMRERMGL